jgi:hypothetical protein
MLLAVLIVLIALIILYFISTYNGLIRLNNFSHEGWSGAAPAVKFS